MYFVMFSLYLPHVAVAHRRDGSLSLSQEGWFPSKRHLCVRPCALRSIEYTQLCALWVDCFFTYLSQGGMRARSSWMRAAPMPVPISLSLFLCAMNSHLNRIKIDELCDRILCWHKLRCLCFGWREICTL